jgi:hypothetical protein
MIIERSACRGWFGSLAFPSRALASLALGVGLGCSSASKDGGQSDLSGGPLFNVGQDQGLANGSDPSQGPGYTGPVCAGETAGAELAPATLELLVDTSGSMSQRAPGVRGSKWQVTSQALLSAIDGMPGETSVGIVFYPNVPNNAQPCFDQSEAVSVAPLAAAGSAQRQKINTAVGRQNPRGGTPTHDAYRYTLTQLEAASTAGSRFVVLITDGQATYSLGCKGGGQNAVDPQPLIDEAARALAAGVYTFVIGSPGSEGARTSLSQMAEAGGTATPGCSHNGPNYCHFDMTTQTDLGAGLANALSEITGIALSCRYDVPPAPAGNVLDPDKVNILFTPPGGTQQLIPRSSDSGCASGWQYSADQSQVQLCGSTCDEIRSSKGGVTLQFGCATLVH